MTGWLLAAGCAILLAGPSGPVAAQEASEAPASDEIVVTGSREGTLDLPRLLSARAAFGKDRAAFAPSSVLVFQLRPLDGGSPTGLALTLRDGERSDPVPIDARGYFSLPAEASERAVLAHNRAKARFVMRALVLSPGTDVSERLLGDLRLQCRVSWELRKSSYSLIARTAFTTTGGCASSRIAFFFPAAAPIGTATIDEHGRSLPLPLSDDRSRYRPPLSDKAWSNAARVTVRYP